LSRESEPKPQEEKRHDQHDQPKNDSPKRTIMKPGEAHKIG
jgi:hypothetical protein